MGILRAGSSIVDITPPLGMELAGYPHYPRHNTGVKTPLVASCLFFDNDENRLALVGLDTLFLSKKHIEEISRRVYKKIQLPAENIMISVSHSHSTPWAAGRLDMESLVAQIPQDADYIEELCSKISALIVSASRTTFQCEIGFDKEPCGREKNVGGNRRDPENGPCDPNTYVVSVKDTDGVVRAIYVNYAVHPTLLHANNTLCSPDYPGYIREYLKNEYPQANMVFSLGASGDQSTRYFRNGQTFEEAKRIGYAIGEAAKTAIERMQYKNDASLNAKMCEYTPKLRGLPPKSEAEEQVEIKKEIYDNLVKSKADYIDIQNANVTLLGAEDVLGYILLKEKNIRMELVEDEIPAKLAVMEIGDITIAGMPGEVFMGISLELRNKINREKLIINTVTNGCLPGYVYTREDAKIGGYEVDTSMLDEDTGYEMISKILDLINQEGD